MKKNMEPGELEKSVFCLQPSRPILCTTKNADWSDHVAPFGWCVPISQNPPMLALAIQDHPRKSQTLRNLEERGEFVVNLPDMSLAENMVLASFDTRLGENKVDRSSFTRLSAQRVSPCRLAECRAHLECSVRSILYPGDHGVILADILAASYDEEAFSDNMLIDVRHYQPVIHLQNFHIKDAPAQIHVFLKSDCVDIKEVPYPRAEGEGDGQS